jgi:hypothetical protein
VIILGTIRISGSLLMQPKQPAFCSVVALMIALTPFALAQATLTAKPAPDEPGTANARLELPDSPGALLTASTSSTAASSSVDASADSADPTEFSFGQDQTRTVPKGQTAPKAALHMQMVISPKEIAEPMSVRDKVLGGLKSSVSLYSAVGWITSAGYEHVLNSSPNYGTNSEAFAQRFGAAVARGVSEGVFSNSLFAPLFHEDPRYYIMGPGHSFFKRLVYAGTRSIITRTDSGKTTPNFSLIAGNAAGSALTIVYYPSINTTTTEVLSTWGTSLGGSALGFVVDEFIVDVLIDLHIKKQQP